MTPIQTLKHEHEVILQVLKAAEREAEAIGGQASAISGQPSATNPRPRSGG